MTKLLTLTAALAAVTLGISGCQKPAGEQRDEEMQQQQQEEQMGTQPAEPGTDERTGFPAEEDEQQQMEEQEQMGEGGAGGSGSLMENE